MSNEAIISHIAEKEAELKRHQQFAKHVEELHATHCLKEETMKEIRAKVSSAIAACEISIRDHQQLLPA